MKRTQDGPPALAENTLITVWGAVLPAVGRRPRRIIGPARLVALAELWRLCCQIGAAGALTRHQHNAMIIAAAVAWAARFTEAEPLPFEPAYWT